MGGVGSITSKLQQFGFRIVDPFWLLQHITNSVVQVILTIFEWVYLAAELGILIGALIFVFGAMAHQSRWKANGGRLILFAVGGYALAVIGPGVIMGINRFFHS